MFEIILSQQSIAHWKMVIYAVCRVAKISVARYELEKGLEVAYPLFEAGRKMVALSCTKGIPLSQKTFAVELSTMIISECLMLATLIARQDMTSSTGEVILQIFHYWLAHSGNEGSPKSTKFFCQVMIFAWKKKWSRQARRGMPIDDHLLIPCLLSDTEREIFAI